MFFYGKDATGKSTGSQTLWIPYAGVAVAVLVLSAIFFFAPVPDVKAEDDYKLDEQEKDGDDEVAVRHVNRGLSFVLLLGNAAALLGVVTFILWLTFDALNLGPSLVGLASSIPHPSSVEVTAETSIGIVLAAGACIAMLIAAVALGVITSRLTHHSLWSHEHFTGATLAQFLYVAAQCGIFAFLINYMTSETPPIPASWASAIDTVAADVPTFMHDLFVGWFETDKAGVLRFSNKFASYLASFGFLWFLAGRVTGAALLRKLSAHKMLGLYSVINAALCLVIFLKLGWLSVLCVFLCYFFMSITFPTIFALGIFGLGARAKGASSFIVMAIVGGALLPKVMGAIADHSNMSRGFIVPLICFVFIALYGYGWPKLSRAEALHGVGASGGH
jgi:FHS family L-fucose permease-like MFS transporter